jgi:hypothetical protein
MHAWLPDITTSVFAVSCSATRAFPSLDDSLFNKPAKPGSFTCTAHPIFAKTSIVLQTMSVGITDGADKKDMQ